MARQVSITGNVHVEPANGVPGMGGDFPLQLAALALAHVRLDAVDLAAATPLVIATTASVVFVRAPVDVVVTVDSPAGAGQAVTAPAYGLFALWAAAGVPFANVTLTSAVAVSGVEILVG